MVYDPRGRTAVVVLDNLPPLALGQVYQLWLLRPDAPDQRRDAGPGRRGDEWRRRPRRERAGPLQRGRQTLEPAPGRAAPSGPFVVRTSL